MKILKILVFVLCFAVFTNAQVLTGTVFDSQGAIIPNAKVKVVSEKGQIFETESNEAGVYTLNLPANLYNSGTLTKDLKAAIYEIIAESSGFEKYSLNDFKFVSSYQNKMILDIALDGANPEPCGYGGADCLPNSTKKLMRKIQKYQIKF